MLLHRLHINYLGYAALEQDRLLIVEAAVPDPHIVIASRRVEAEAASCSCAYVVSVQVHVEGTCSGISNGHRYAAGYGCSYGSWRRHGWV